MFDDDAVIPLIAIFSYEPAPPKDMGSLHQDTRSLRTERRERKKERRKEGRKERKKEAQQAIEEEVKSQKEDDKKDKTLNVELAKGSSLATLRAPCSFLVISSSGSKLKVYTKIFNHNKKMELLNPKAW